MSIHYMSIKQYADFTEDRSATVLKNFPSPKDVKVLNTSSGMVIVIDYGQNGVTLIGDSIGVYWGEKAPVYFA